MHKFHRAEIMPLRRECSGFGGTTRHDSGANIEFLRFGHVSITIIFLTFAQSHAQHRSCAHSTMVKSLTLYELNNIVAETIDCAMPGEYWVEAELAEIREVRGNCYMELVQKEPGGNTPVARASAKCWRTRWPMVSGAFQRVTGQRMSSGMKVMLSVYANFHEAYGFSWIVTDVNPEYTMGDMARRRKEIIAKLKAEGVYDLQHELSLPMFAQSIAVVSSAGAAGYGDFCHQLQHNERGFSFSTTLFAAIVQGEQVEQSIIAALNDIYERQDEYDAVVIIRGGGSTSDLSGFDTLALAENVANFPLPIITGIGHERDESVLDLVSCVSVKTPTAAAALLIDNLKAVDDALQQATDTATRWATLTMQRQRLRLARIADAVPALFSVAKTRQEARLDLLRGRMQAALSQRMTDSQHRLAQTRERMQTALQRTLTDNRHRLNMLQQRANAQDPARLLARGYSITTLDGKAVVDASAIAEGSTLTTRLHKGSVTSVVKKSE